MSEDILVSVIVLTYNHEKYIRQALEGILMQRVDFQYEILVGDDASTDGTQAILKEYDRKYPGKFKLFLRGSNLGAAKNAYGLLLEARGKYLATCEGDDYWTDPEKLRIQVDFLERNPEFVGCTHYFTIVDCGGEPVRNQSLSWLKQKPVFSAADFMGFYLPGQPSTFLRRNIILEHPDDYSFFYSANLNISDRVAMMRFLEYGKFGLVERKMSAYRKHADNSQTLLFYERNGAHAIIDYEIQQALKKEASERGKTSAFHLEKHDPYVFSELFFCAVLNGNGTARKLLKEMFREDGRKAEYALAVSLGLLRKLKWKIKEL